MTSKRSLLLPLAVLALGLTTASQSQAAIVVVAPTPSTAGSITITQDITVLVTAAASAAYLVMDEWVTSNGSASASSTATKFVFSLNGAPDKTGSTSSALFDNANSFSAVTINDGLLLFDQSGSGNELAVGNTFTFRAGTHSIDAGSGFNPQGTQTFTGDVFLINAGGGRMSANTPVGGAVPEPGSTALGALAGLTLLRRRRR